MIDMEWWDNQLKIYFETACHFKKQSKSNLTSLGVPPASLLLWWLESKVHKLWKDLGPRNHHYTIEGCGNHSERYLETACHSKTKTNSIWPFLVCHSFLYCIDNLRVKVTSTGRVWCQEITIKMEGCGNQVKSYFKTACNCKKPEQ